jgi:hypothetical protein
MRKFLFIIIILLSLSCTNKLDRRILEKDSYKYFTRIEESLDSAKAEQFKWKYKQILILGEVGSDEAKVRIIMDYSKRYEDITYRDILNKLDEKK